jgi:hypothetical protein
MPSARLGCGTLSRRTTGTFGSDARGFTVRRDAASIRTFHNTGQLFRTEHVENAKGGVFAWRMPLV